MREITGRQAVNEALREEMERDENVFLIGEDIGIYGGAFGVTNGLLDKFGEKRVRDTPISEAGIAGAAVGASLMGMRPVAEMMFMDFITIASDQIINQGAKIHYMFGGQMNAPFVLRMPAGAAAAGAQHTQSLEALLYHIPGLKVVMPSTPYDLKGLLKTSIRDDNPVMFIEHKKGYGEKGEVPEEEYTIPFGQADIKREGEDLTIIATSHMVFKALKAAEELAKQGIDAEVLDPRTLVPLDMESIVKSVSKTGRAVVVHEAHRRGGIGGDIVARIVDSEAFYYLETPIKRITGPNTPVPFSPVLESEFIPSEEKIIKGVLDILD
ncbi:alpha-ketoacid dehydrogenase subunit beta [Halanaerobium sp. Z-7514]|uniref:Alpha-ketoacid dehydrogenase subunit beta n=1 Tax=Halanaerobium polyolivorans TaxID=2886943 RepID=A0AAW4WVQ3_9FIRM|nr:alpha-ketoacid dehydrogenase subunit beta [Halanaerobium polyolivorans]MCC3144635.1 alpha-ketoacid dehydrogenase subunit beta [Halanaerobium polyolivorans]RQD74818.1 MAG: alpha-ketoacid dehydrogenase subunit beta [Halanaerobium sp. MSAO_Bac5]